MDIKTDDDIELCRFCLKVISDQNFDIIGDITLQVLNILAIKMDFSIDGKPVMCRNCHDIINKCFDFKSACICSEDNICEYITEGSTLDLEEVYLKQKIRKKLKRIPTGYKICRLCMKLTRTATDLDTADERIALINDELQRYIPELNLQAVKHPVICGKCISTVQSYSEFVSNCLEVEKNISRYCEVRGIKKNQVQLCGVQKFIQSEALTCDISECSVPMNMGKLEGQSKIDINNTIPSAIPFNNSRGRMRLESKDENESGNRLYGNIETELVLVGREHFLDGNQCITNEEIVYKENCTSELDTEEKPDTLNLPGMIPEDNADESKLHLSTNHDSIKEDVVELYIENGEIEIRSDTEKSHTKDPEPKVTRKVKPRRRKCNSTHGESSKPLNECDKCSFKTYCRATFHSHRKVHQTHTYQCKDCPFKTKYKGNLRDHSKARHQSAAILINKDIHKTDKDNSKVQIHSCALCSYKTIDKRHMKYHEQTHKDKSELVTYDCFHCSYKGKRKAHLIRHLTQHKTMTNLIPYQCNTCEFVTADKTQLVFTNKSQGYCKECSVRRESPTEQNMKESDPPQLTLFKCELCPFKAKARSKLYRHNDMSHRKGSEGPSSRYKCTHCGYRGRDKADLKMHLHTHNDSSLGKVPMVKCELCSYQTVHKSNLERHVQSHKNNPGVELWKCEFCGGSFNKYHVKQHQRACSGQQDVEPDSCNGEGANKES